MYLSRFGVKNYKCLGEIDIPLTPIHVLIGQNDCGKTSVLEAMEAFLNSKKKLPDDMFPEPWRGRELVRHAHPDPLIELYGEWAEATTENTVSSSSEPQYKYHVSLEFALTGHCCGIVSESDTILSLPFASSMASHTTDGTENNRKKHSRNDTDHDSLEECGILKSAHKYALDAKIMAVPAVVDMSRKFKLDPDGFGLATLLNDIVSYDPDLFLRLRSDFCRYYPQFKSIHTETAEAWKRMYSPNGIHGSSSADGVGIFFDAITGQTIRAQQASDGAILFLAFLALAYLPKPPGILLIEEPENGIYPKRLGQVIELLKQMVHRTDGVRFPQIIMTTHSPYVLSFFEPEEVTLLSRPAEPADAPVRARPLRDAPNIRERMGDEFYLGELWYNLSEEDLFGDA